MSVAATVKAILLVVTILVINKNAPSVDARNFAVYYQSWSAHWVSNGSQAGLAQLPSYANVVLVAFMNPDCQYQGNYNLAGTGLQFPYDGPTFKQAVDALRRNHPATRILVSIGGAAFSNWDSANASCAAAFIRDFNLDGVDIDYEPTNPNCQITSQGVHCTSDQDYISIINKYRAAVPKGKQLLTAAVFSVGAYGEGQFANDQPISPNTGVALAMLKQNGQQLDMINVMSYDAGDSYVPSRALQAYSYYYNGIINMGVEVPPEAWGGHIYTVSDINQLGASVMARPTAGMMLWSAQKQGGSDSPSNPDANLQAATICNILKLSDCAAPIDIN